MLEAHFTVPFTVHRENPHTLRLRIAERFSPLLSPLQASAPLVEAAAIVGELAFLDRIFLLLKVGESSRLDSRQKEPF